MLDERGCGRVGPYIARAVHNPGQWGSGQIFDQRPLSSKLANAKTMALVKARHFEAIRLIVRADAEIPPHQVAGKVMLHCLEGLE